MYSLDKSVAQIRTKMRQQYERHRFVAQLPVVDMLLFQCHSEFQVSPLILASLVDLGHGFSRLQNAQWLWKGPMSICGTDTGLY